MWSMLSFKPNARSSSNVTTEGRCAVCNSDIMIQLYSNYDPLKSPTHVLQSCVFSSAESGPTSGSATQAGRLSGTCFCENRLWEFLARTYVSAFPSIDRSIPFPSFDPSQRKKKEKGLTIRDIVFDFEHSILCIMLHVSGIFCMFFASSCIFVWSIFVAL